MHKRLSVILTLAISCPGHAEPARYPVPAPPRAAEAGPAVTVDDCRALPAKSQKTVVANGSGRRRWPVESYATAITPTKEPNA